jgi:signal transduction histidine kinase
VTRLRARVAELERERARLEDFAAVAAHEMLRPLVIAESYAATVRERAGHGLDLDSRRDLDALIRISGRVRRLVETMLADACDRHELLHVEEVDLKEIIRDCLRTLDEEIHARDAKLEIDPMPVVKGDPALLSGVFQNLLSNALKYGGAEIRLSATRSEGGWMFTVESPGPAIPEPERERIFEPWARGLGKRRVGGAGLGLAIVRQIVERHGGRTGVTSARGSTNAFYFTLPV